MPYNLVDFKNGTTSIENTLLREPMHSKIGPEAEAQAIYIAQSSLGTLLNQNCSEPLVIFDLGLGIAANALLAMDIALSIKPKRTLQIYSFENDITGLEFALDHLDTFQFLKPHREKSSFLLKNKKWTSDDAKIEWHLNTEDFLTCSLELFPSPEIIFFDFYSPKSTPKLWSLSIFKKLFATCKSNRGKNKNTTLMTYSSATAIRSALLLSGFYVGYGKPTPAKLSTTIATTLPQYLENPLDERWLERWTRSEKPLPLDWPHSKELAKTTICERLREQEIGKVIQTSQQQTNHTPPKQESLLQNSMPYPGLH